MNKIKTRIILTEKGQEFSLELSEQRQQLPYHVTKRVPKLILCQSQRSMNTYTQCEQILKKKERVNRSITQCLPKYCEIQGFQESSKEINKSCDLEHIFYKLQATNQRQRVVSVIIHMFDSKYWNFINKSG